MKKLKTAVSGLGRIGWKFHLPSIIAHEGFELTAVADPLHDRIDEAYKKYGVKGYTSYIDLLDNEKIDLMVVASPTIFHVEQTIASFEHGIDVFLEKPMTPSLEEADILINSMQKNNRKLMVYQPDRVTHEFQALKSLVARGLIGPVYMIKHARSEYERRNDWQSLKQYGGGMLNNYGAHLIDQLLELAGSRAGRISCSMRKIVSMGDADDVVKAIIETENGIILDMDINMATAYELPKWYVLGSRGTIVFEVNGDNEGIFKAKYLLDDEMTELPLRSELAAADRRYGGFDRLKWHEEQVVVSSFKEIDYYEKCYSYYALDGDPYVPVRDTREVMRVIRECRRDAGWADV